MLQLQTPLERIPPALAGYRLELSGGGGVLTYTFDARDGRTGISTLLNDLGTMGIQFKDLHTTQSSLEEIFVSLVRDGQ